ncbi:MAG: peptidase MA family metallohydrolase [Acidobacteria bacterium]|nr:peptidase MA family metallohydrolase [Acidobacteriota bacterium]MCL5286516.1 peptidase MA family metallohydrolase [Acidobacteriota bacterium]
MRRILTLAFLLCVLALPVLADTIVLKSGRRISATNVVEEGDRIYFETPSGRLSFAKSAVQRIERGGDSAWGSGGTSDDSKKVDLAAAAPAAMAVDGNEEVARATVKDGALDRNYLAKLESEAQNGSPLAVARVLAALNAAALFELKGGDVDAAIGHYRRALDFAPKHLGALLNIAHLHLRKSEFTNSLAYLETANQAAPDNADVARLMGWAYYGMNKIELAVREFRRAFKLRPDVATQQALLKAERDLEIEEKFKKNESFHFKLSYDGEAEPGLAREVLKRLEDHFAVIESELSFSPSDSIGVILYTAQAFRNVSRAPGWAGALNDGRIRVPVQGLTSMTPELSATLKHELTHSFVFQKTRGQCPVWLNEGVAQYLEGARSGEYAADMIQLYAEKKGVSLATLEGSWLGLSGGGATFAYAWSLAAVEYLVRAHGMGDIVRLLDRLAAEPSVAAALRSVLRMSYLELEAETIRYLQKTY